MKLLALRLGQSVTLLPVTADYSNMWFGPLETQNGFQTFYCCWTKENIFFRGNLKTAKPGDCPTINQQEPSDISILLEMREIKLHFHRDGMYISPEWGGGGGESLVHTESP
uniref:B30.2/SPRY domain-containing protein n=1 Tax=Xenopus tropicalis TaxID=8364 RepID=A0A1B8Y1Y6_XENTR